MSPNRELKGDQDYLPFLYHSFIIFCLGGSFNVKSSTLVKLGLFTPHLLTHLPVFKSLQCEK